MNAEMGARLRECGDGCAIRREIWGKAFTGAKGRWHCGHCIARQYSVQRTAAADCGQNGKRDCGVASLHGMVQQNPSDCLQYGTQRSTDSFQSVSRLVAMRSPVCARSIARARDCSAAALRYARAAQGRCGRRRKRRRAALRRIVLHLVSATDSSSHDEAECAPSCAIVTPVTSPMSAARTLRSHGCAATPMPMAAKITTGR